MLARVLFSTTIAAFWMFVEWTLGTAPRLAHPFKSTRQTIRGTRDCDANCGNMDVQFGLAGMFGSAEEQQSFLE